MAEKSTASASPETETAAEMTPEQRAEMAGKVVERFAIYSGVAGLVPLPGIDVIAVGGLQVQMLRRISQIFDVPFSENSGKSLIAALAGSLIPASSGLGAASALKFVPIAGPLAAAFVMPALSAGATYAIGKAFIQHFASGGTLLDFNPPDYREFIKAQKAKWDARKSSGADTTSGTATSSP
jgi:uncharacterized protein (DUF697 family)